MRSARRFKDADGLTALAFDLPFLKPPIARFWSGRTQGPGEFVFADRFAGRIFSRRPWYDRTAVWTDKSLLGSAPLRISAALGAGMLAQRGDVADGGRAPGVRFCSKREKIVECRLRDPHLTADLAALQLSAFDCGEYVGNLHPEAPCHLLGRKHLGHAGSRGSR